jgi:hypothetical protein
MAALDGKCYHEIKVCQSIEALPGKGQSLPRNKLNRSLPPSRNRTSLSRATIPPEVNAVHRQDNVEAGTQKAENAEEANLLFPEWIDSI